MSLLQPAEWAPHDRVWTAWPSAAHLWLDDLGPAQAEVANLIRAIDDDGHGEVVELLVHGDEAAASAHAALGDTRTRFHQVRFGDIWLRDTGPIFVREGDRLAARDFGFNGWGGKFDLPGDAEVAAFVAERAAVPAKRCDWILEGGAIDTDGAGLVVTTEQCLLNPNRNPALSRAEIEARLAADLGLDRVLWLGDGLAGDHTDGHVDNLARFVAPGVLALPLATEADDPNAAVYADARARARAFGLAIADIPSPGRVTTDDEVVAASYMNFYIANTVVVVPLYDRPNDDAAVRAVQDLFPTRRAVGLPAAHILTGGGSFHCITQQQPRLAVPEQI